MSEYMTPWRPLGPSNESLLDVGKVNSGLLTFSSVVQGETFMSNAPVSGCVTAFRKRTVGSRFSWSFGLSTQFKPCVERNAVTELTLSSCYGSTMDPGFEGRIMTIYSLVERGFESTEVSRDESLQLGGEERENASESTELSHDMCY